MKVLSLRIRSFGELRERKIDFDDELTVIYGKNETGKTSFMEFIRGTLFPDNQRNHYPEYRTTDSGELDFEIASGDKFTITREGKKARSEKMPSDIVHMDSSLYRSLFAMSPEDLRDSKVITSGEIKNRFLTVPGGESLPKVIEDIESEMKDIMSVDRKSSSTKVARLFSDIENNDMAVKRSKELDGSYGEKSNERNELQKISEDLKEKKKESDVEVASYSIQRSQSANLVKLDELKKKKDTISASAEITDSDKTKYEELKVNLANIKRETEDARSVVNEFQDSTDGIDPKILLVHRTTIEDLKHKEQLYVQLSRQRKEFQDNENNAIKEINNEPVKREMVQKSRPSVGLIALGAMVFAATVFIGLLSNILVSVVGAVVFVACIIIAFKKGQRRESSVSSDKTVDSRQVEYWHGKVQELDGNISSIEKDLDILAKRTGLARSSFMIDVDRLYNALGNALKISDAETVRDKLDVLESRAQSDLNLFLSRFGSEQRFKDLCEMKKEYDSICYQIDTLEKSIESSGYFNGAQVIELPDTEGIQEKMNEVQRKIGDIDRQLRSMREDDEMERLLDMRTLLTTELYNTVKRWAVLSLASSMIEDACNTIYSDIQPGVITTADHLVRTMTCERYGLEMDIRTNEVRVRSGDTGKKEKEWSTGLGDQVYLAIKLAIAKEMSGSETLPILLDDVLQMFDSERKKNACKSLVELSKDMQIILFTCDVETLSMMRSIDACKVIELANIE